MCPWVPGTEWGREMFQTFINFIRAKLILALGLEQSGPEPPESPQAVLFYTITTRCAAGENYTSKPGFEDIV